MAGAGTDMLVAINGLLVGAVLISDLLKPEAAGLVGGLERMGTHCVMTSGDD